MTASESHPFVASRLLPWSARAWFVTALIGQWLFAIYILWALLRPLLLGDRAGYNRTGPITGHVPGDHLSNATLLGHLLAAFVLSAVGLLQLLPTLRQRFPAWHRWAGRMFIGLALVAALSGLYLTWIRGSRLSDISAIAISLNGLLIVAAVLMAWRLARQRRYAEHRRWAIRAFLLVSGVWTLRLGLMAWFILNQGANGNTGRLDGPADIALTFGCYLLPLALAELYFRAELAARNTQRVVACVLLCGAALTALGTFGAFTGMWAPHF